MLQAMRLKFSNVHLHIIRATRVTHFADRMEMNPRPSTLEANTLSTRLCMCLAIVPKGKRSIGILNSKLMKEALKNYQLGDIFR